MKLYFAEQVDQVTMWCPDDETTYTLQPGDEVEYVPVARLFSSFPVIVLFNGKHYNIRDWKLDKYFLPQQD